MRDTIRWGWHLRIVNGLRRSWRLAYIADARRQATLWKFWNRAGREYPWNRKPRPIFVGRVVIPAGRKRLLLGRSVLRSTESIVRVKTLSIKLARATSRGMRMPHVP
jgi:hypothetical protein